MGAITTSARFHRTDCDSYDPSKNSYPCKANVERVSDTHHSILVRSPVVVTENRRRLKKLGGGSQSLGNEGVLSSRIPNQEDSGARMCKSGPVSVAARLL